MNFKKGLVYLIALSVFFLGGCLPKNESVETESQTEIDSNQPETSEIYIDFAQEGNLSKGNQPETGPWFLVYDLPGNPAANVTLQFSEESLCHINNIDQPCDPESFNPGDLVYVEGKRLETEIAVAELTIIND